MGMHATEFVQNSAAAAGASEIPPVVVMAGKEDLLKQQCLAAIATSVLGADSDEMLQRVDGQQAAWRDVNDELATRSMFSTHRVVLVERAEEFIKKNRGILEDYVSQPAQHSVLVLETRSWPGNTKLAKAVTRAGLTLECTELEGAALTKWLVGTAKRRFDVTLTREAAVVMVALAGSRLTQLEQELAKLSSCSQQDTVGVDMVRSLVGGWQVQTTFEMLGAVRNGRTPDALAEFGKLWEAKEPLQKLMGGVAFVYRRLARATELARQGRGLNDALKQAKVFYREIPESNRYLRRIGRAEAESFVERLLEVDKGLKGQERLPGNVQFERLLVQLGGTR